MHENTCVQHTRLGETALYSHGDIVYVFLYSVHSVVIDCAPISFLDAVGVNALKQLVLDFYKCDVQVVFASMTSKT